MAGLQALGIGIDPSRICGGRYLEAMPELKSTKKSGKKTAAKRTPRKRSGRKTTPDEVHERILAIPKPKDQVKVGRGRPTKYNKDFPQAIVDYFTSCWEEIADVERNVAVTGHLQFVQKPTEVPTFEGFAMVSGVCTETLYEWAGVHDDFSNAMKVCRNISVRCTHRLSGAGGMPPALGIFTLKNTGKWTDRHEVELGGPVTLLFDSQDEEA